MSAVKYRIDSLENKQPLFKEFCNLNGLKNGDYYKPVDFLFYTQSLTLVEMLKVVRKYKPDFKLPNCNL